MKTKTFLYSLLALTLLVSLAFGVKSISPDSSWPVPDKYKNMKNPVAADSESISTGKSLYTLHCKSCHGKEGLGDGSKAAQLDTPCGDFTDEAFQSQTDGALYYKTAEGRDDMPGFRNKIPDSDDLWSLVNYLRTLE